MKQQINLMTARPAHQLAVWWTMFAMVVFFSSVLVWWTLRYVQITQLVVKQHASQQAVEKIQAQIVQKREALGLTQSQLRTLEIARFKEQLALKREWLNLLQKGELGTTSGPSQLLISLGSLDVNDLWLDHVELVKGGQSLTLSGEAFRLETVVQYANRLNQALQEKGAFFSMETRHETITSPHDSQQKMTIVRFKLY